MAYKEDKMTKGEIVRFFIYFVMICLVSFAFLYLFGLVPESLKSNIVKYPQKEAEALFAGVEPTRIVINKIEVDALVYNPENSDIKSLNKYLTSGAVRYPGSGLIGKGNMFVFGHSADIYNTVNNPAYKTFNGIAKLEYGDEILVYAESKSYLYRVTSVSLVGADKALVEFGGTENKLTISTCNTFGAKEERHVVEAKYVGLYNGVI